jgi:hypothetical protein
MNSYLEILFWTVTIYIITVAIVHFIKVLKEKKENNTNLTKAIVYLAGGLALAMLLLYKPFGASVIKIADKLVKRPITAATEAVMITSIEMGPTSVSV